MTSRTFVLRLTIRPEKVRARIASSIDLAEPSTIRLYERGFFLTYSGNRPFLGRIKDGSFWIRRRIDYVNSFTPLFIGSVQPSGDGSTITGYFRVHRVVYAILIWISGAVWLACIFIFLRHDPEPLIFLVPTFIATFCVLFLIAGRNWLGQTEKREIVDFLTKLFADCTAKNR